MATLGDILASARQAATIERWLTAADLDLAQAIGEAASREGEPLDCFARIVVADFTRAADENAWTTLLSRVRDSSDPGLACLSEMVRWRLSLAATGGAAERSAIGSDQHAGGAEHGDEADGQKPIR
jgi:hypothetical protein